ncbi:MAG: hypothetical protein A3G91_04950 [Omnitrophica WOR_2 bacterium RIFCSPLOWO2_12_FULL_50_9]|nr:MAG: hypothetical protein A3G91_04950 [Omnitrophica WOR_2 bacterium RIFCSPLOWO2_12_FULL_50_9]
MSMNEDILEIVQLLEIVALTGFISILAFFPMWSGKPESRRYYIKLLIAAFFIFVVSFFMLKASP